MQNPLQMSKGATLICTWYGNTMLLLGLYTWPQRYKQGHEIIWVCEKSSNFVPKFNKMLMAYVAPCCLKFLVQMTSGHNTLEQPISGRRATSGWFQVDSQLLLSGTQELEKQWNGTTSSHTSPRLSQVLWKMTRTCGGGTRVLGIQTFFASLWSQLASLEALD